MLRHLSVVVALVSGCVRGAGGFQCGSSGECTLDGVAGVCEPEGYCSFPDTACASGARFGERSGPLAGVCVGAITTDGRLSDTRSSDSTGDGMQSSARVVIGEVYGAGGKSGSVFERDYVLLRNVDSSAVSLAGWSFQHYKTGAGWRTVALPAMSVGAGTTFLIGLYYDGGTAAGTGLPSPGLDTPQDSDWNLSTSNGEAVAITTSTAVLTSCTDPAIVDLVGTVTGAPCSEGGSVAPTSTPTQSAQRKGGGTQDTNDNGADFVLAAPTI